MHYLNYRNLLALIISVTICTPLAQADELDDQTKAQMYTLSVLFSPVTQFCDQNTNTSDKRYSSSLKKWAKINAKELEQGQLVANKMLASIEQDEDSFYQPQIDELLQEMAKQSTSDLILNCDRLKARFELANK
jgi:hypothetical protein